MAQLAPEVTARLREKREKEALKDAKSGRVPLPDPGAGYSEKEAAKAWGIPWGDWMVMNATHRAEMWAHEQHRAMREAAMADDGPASAPEKDLKRPSARASMLSHYGVA